MKKELVNEIIAIYPEIYRYEDWDNIQKSLMSFGFDCGDGWFELLKKLTTKIKQYDVDKNVRVLQVKEKFGSLRFYINGGNEDIDNAIQEAEAESSEVCAICGKPSTKQWKGWITFLCDDCYEERMNSK